MIKLSFLESFLLLQHKCTISCLDVLLSSFTFIIRDIYMKTAFFFCSHSTFPNCSCMEGDLHLPWDWGCQAQGSGMGMGPLHAGQLPVLQRGCSSSSLALCSLYPPCGFIGMLGVSIPSQAQDLFVPCQQREAAVKPSSRQESSQGFPKCQPWLGSSLGRES